MSRSHDPRPLAGRRILITRRPEQAGRLASGLAALGASVIEIPTLELARPEDPEPLDRALARLHRYDWLVFTSSNAVRAVGQRLLELGLDPAPVGRALPVASVGAVTSEAFREQFQGAEVSLQPAAGFRAEALVELFEIRGCAGQSLLLPTSDRARGVLPRGLAALGAQVEKVVAYRTVVPEGLAERLAAGLRGGVDLVVFASPSAVEAFLAASEEQARGVPAAVIGPTTEQASRAGGLDVRVVASPSTAAGLVSAIESYCRGKGVGDGDKRRPGRGA